MSRHGNRNRVAGLIAVVILIGLVGATLATPNEDDSGAATTPTTAAPTSTTTTAPTTTTVLDPATLGADGKELYALVQAGRASQYYVRFQLSGSSLPLSATSAFLEIWRAGPQLRQDTKLEEAAGVTHGANFGGPDGTVTCQEQPGLELSCRQDSTEAVSPGDDFLSSVMDRLSGAEIVGRDDTVIGLAVRCFVLDGGNATDRSEICLTAGGVPLVVEVPGLRADALETSGTVDPGIFVPPAPVSGPSESTTLSTTLDTTVTPSTAGG